MSNQGGTDPRIAFGAQPAEVELTDEEVRPLYPGGDRFVYALGDGVDSPNSV